jgi:methyl-accepting chemotaxis protein
MLLSLGCLAVILSISVSYFVAERQIVTIMRADITTIADALEKSINYIAAIRPDAYKEQDFKQFVNNTKIGKSGYLSFSTKRGLLWFIPVQREKILPARRTLMKFAPARKAA